MTETTKEILEKYQVRKTGKQKAAFREYALGVTERLGYNARIEPGSLGAKNIVIGNPDRAKVIFTAHYDTAPRLPIPNFITPKNIAIYLLYQMVLTFVLVLLPMILAGALAAVPLGILSAEFNIPEEVADAVIYAVVYGALFVSMLLILIGPANKHTANDNTSGVTCIFDLMASMPEELRESAAFVLFDLEEVGLFGSAGFAARHKDVKMKTLVVNFDCISDGDDIIFVLKKGARSYSKYLSEAFPSEESFRVEVLQKGAFYPSDQVSFNVGVGVAALKKFRGTNILFMNRIHTSRDIIYKEKNVELLTSGSIRLTERLSEVIDKN